MRQPPSMMPQITIENIKLLVANAYEAGFRGCLDMKTDYAETVVEEMMLKFDEEMKKWKVYSVKSLREMKSGTTFVHAELGECMILKGVDGKKSMTFTQLERIENVSLEKDSKDASIALNTFKMPMKLLVGGEKDEPVVIDTKHQSGSSRKDTSYYDYYMKKPGEW